MIHRNILRRPRVWTVLLGICVALACPTTVAQEAAQEASSPAAVELYRSAAQLQNSGVYDLAVEEWSTLLERHPQDPLATRARHNRGICLFQLRKYSDAAADFAAVAEAPGKFDQLEATLVNLGLANFNLAQQADEADRSLVAKALAAFDRQLKEFPEGSNSPLARFYRAEALYSMGRLADAAESYLAFLDRYPAHELKPRAVYGLAVAQSEQGFHAQAEATLRRFLAEHAQDELAADAHLHLGDALFAQGKFGEATRSFAAAAADQGFVHADYALLRHAAALFEQDSFAEAAQLYAALVERFGQSPHAPTAELNAGKAWLRAGEAERAVPFFRAAATRGGANAAEAAHWLSRSLLESGQAKEAQAVAEATLRASPPDEWRAELMLDQADAAYERGEREQALAGYAAMADTFPDHARSSWARYSAADVALALGEPGVARDHAEKLLRLDPQSEHAPSVRFILAEVARLSGDHAVATEALRALVAQYGQHRDRTLWLNRLALVLLTAEDSQGVVETLQRAVDSYPNGDLKGEAEYLLGTAHLRLGEFDNAVRFLHRSVGISQTAAYLDAARLNLARAQHGAGASEEAIETLQQLIGRSQGSPFVPEAVYRLGVFEATDQDHAAALTAFNRLIAEWPQSRFVPHALYGAATSHRAAGDLAASKAALDRLLAAYPRHETAGPARLLRASLLRELGDPSAAIEDVAIYLEISPRDSTRADALYLQGLCQAELKQYASAIGSFRQLLQDHPTYVTADRVLYELAWAYKEAGEEQDARTTFTALAEKFPQSDLAAEAIFRVGESQYEAKEYAVAAKAYAAALAARPATEIREKAAHKEAWAYFQLDEFESAATRFASQLEAHPDGELALDARVMLAECLFQQRKYPQAFAEFERVLPAVGASQSLQIVALLHAAQSASQVQQWEKALDLLEQCAKRFPESDYRDEVRYEMGLAKYHLGRHDEAHADFAAVAERHPGVLGVRAQFMQGEIEMAKKNYADAVRIFYRVAFGHGYPDAPAEYHPWQSAAMFDAARCLEQLGREDAARKLYQDLVAQFPKQDHAEHARKRLEELGS